MSIFKDFVKPILVLSIICLVTSSLLAFTNNATAPVIKENEVATATASRRAAFPHADTSKPAEGLTSDNVTEVYKADNGAGYVITAQAKGYGGQVPVMVAFNADGNIAAVKFLDNDETPGLGQKVKDAWFGEQFAGRQSDVSLALAKNGGDVDAISGATISSTAAVNALNGAMEMYKEAVKQ